MNPDLRKITEDQADHKISARFNPCGEERPSLLFDSPLPLSQSPSGSVGDLGISITLCSLAQASPSERGLVAKVFLEVARQINETIPGNAGINPQLQHHG